MVTKLTDHRIPVRGLMAFYIAGLVLLWSYFLWDYFNAALLFASPHDRNLFVLGILFFVSGMMMLFLTAILGVWFYVFHDAGRRGMNQWLWTFIAIFTPELLGIVIYLVVRKPLLMECPGCRAPMGPELLYCPQCGRQFRLKCPACGSVVEEGHQFCSSCGSNLSSSGNATP